LGDNLPWDDLVKPYLEACCANNGRPTVDARQVVGAMIIKHLKKLSDENTIAEIQENPYLQYFVGLPEFRKTPLFDASLFVSLRVRLDDEKFDAMNDTIILHFTKSTESVPEPAENSPEPAEEKQPLITDELPKNDPPPAAPNTKIAEITAEKPAEIVEQKPTKVTHKGKLKIDTTVAPQNIKYPTDFNLLNEARVKLKGGHRPPLYLFSPAHQAAHLPPRSP
jgi:hypothetical protein